MNPSEIKQLQNVCMTVSELKSQLIEELPHFGHQALYFENDESLMAVVPSILVYQPKNILQHAQQMEYDMAIYIKKMLGFCPSNHWNYVRRTVF